MFLFVGVGDTVVSNASVEFAAEPEVLAYASVVDNTSGDPIFVLPFADAGTPTTANNPPQGTITSPSGDLSLDAGATVAFAGTAGDPDGDQVTVGKKGHRFTPSYVALHPYVRRPGPESDYFLQQPLEFHAGTSELVQMIERLEEDGA